MSAPPTPPFSKRLRYSQSATAITSDCTGGAVPIVTAGIGSVRPGTPEPVDNAGANTDGLAGGTSMMALAGELVGSAFEVRLRRARNASRSIAATFTGGSRRF